ncbi:MAG: arginase [Chloroflexi bacterium]|nr:arginase [Chloroflexota bacterium]
MQPAIEIVGVPLDLGAGLRGVDMGPSAIRHAGLTPRLRALGLEVVDAGNLPVPVADSLPVGDPRCKYGAAVERVCADVKVAVLAARGRGSLPVVLGGDHSLAAGSLAGHLAARPDLKVLWLDAHGDLNTPATTPSGNVHGMPLAIALGIAGELFGSLGWSERQLTPDRVALVGLRNLDPEERTTIRRLGIPAYTMADVDRQGIHRVIEAALDRLNAVPGALHLSLDLDVVDPLDAPGVGTPVRGGLTFREAHLALEVVATSGLLGSLDAVEVNAIRDHENRTGHLATDLILSALGQTIL